MKHPSDETLIEKIRSGSTSAYGKVMERYERLVMKIVLSYTNNVEDAFDISQDIFFKVYQKLGLYNGKGPFKAWLLRITHNESINWLRRQKRFHEYETLTPSNTPRVHADHDSAMIEDERRLMLQNEILKLNTKQQIAITLRYFEGMPIKEIAEILECTDGVVKSILFRSLEKMRKSLQIQRRNES